MEIKEGENIIKREIETGLSDGLNIEVTAGIEEGDRLIERPPRDLE